MNNLKAAFRSLCKSPGFTLIAVLILALGIGANTAIFSAVHAVLLRPLPWAGSEQLVSVRAMVQRDSWERRAFSMPDFRDYRAQTGASFASFAGFAQTSYNLSGTGEAERIGGETVSHNYFPTLGVTPALGRSFTAEEDSIPDKFPVVVLSDSLWRDRFAADPAIIGRTIRLSETVYTVVGVMPPGFTGLSGNSRLWVPMAMNGARLWENRGNRWHEVVARLKPGVTADQARAELAAVGRTLATAHPATNTNYGADLAPLREELFGNLRQPLLVLLGAVGFVLLITCANVANLLLVRLAGRRRELAIRAALGAGRAVLARLLLAESLVLSLLGGGLALLLAAWLTTGLAQLNPVGLPGYVSIGTNWPVFLFALGLTLLCTLATGLLPALLAGKVDLNTALKDSARGSSPGVAGARLRAGLVVAELALALSLLTAAVLFVRSFANLIGQAPGFRTEQLLAQRVALPGSRYNAAAVRQFTARLQEQAAALPGVRAVALSSDSPLDGTSSASFFTVEGASAVPAENEGRTYTHVVTPEFFQAAGVPLVRGENFARSYPEGSEPVAIVTESFGRRFWPDGNFVGRRFKIGRSDSRAPWMRIIGVVPDARFRGLAGNPTRDPDMFVPFDQRPTGNFTLLVHTTGASAAPTASIRTLVRALDPDLPVYSVATIEERIRRASAGQRFSATLMGGFAVVALLLAALGLYGVVSFAVGARTQEIGVRMALGARPADIFGLILGGTSRLVIAGVLAGLLLSLGLTRFITSLLYEVPPYDPLTYAGVGLLLAAVVFLAAWLPARRAARVDPVVALRAE